MLFDKLYNEKEDSKAERKKPIVLKKVKRGFDSAEDSLLSEIEDWEFDIESLRAKVANGDTDSITKIVELSLDIEEAKKQIKIIKSEKALLLD